MAAIPSAFPEAVVVHIVRDGRDVACSLLEKPWLRREQAEADDAGVPYGAYARFWVEPDRTRRVRGGERRPPRRMGMAELRRRPLGAPATRVEVRYEAMAADPRAAAAELAPHLDVPVGPLADALSRAHAASVGRYVTDLSAEQLADVEAEAGTLLRELGYVSSASA